MLPILIVAASGIAALTYKFKSTCSECDTLFGYNEECLFDGKPVCGKCGKDYEAQEYLGHEISKAGRCCDRHLEAYAADITWKKIAIDKEIAAASAEEANQKWLRAKAANVVTYSKNYKGTVEAPKLGKKILTGWHDDRGEAEMQLKILAVQDGCVLVQQVELKKTIDDSTNYIHSTWQGSGII